jgi:hypothetical protein
MNNLNDHYEEENKRELKIIVGGIKEEEEQ